jgi:hypothetical protein
MQHRGAAMRGENARLSPEALPARKRHMAQMPG